MDNLYNRVSRRRQPGQKGFTLIELLVVIAVLAILAAIVIFNVIGVKKSGSASACNTDKQSVQTASDAYLNDHGVYPNGTGAGDTNGTVTTANTQAVDITALTAPSTGNSYLHTAPGNGETFNYSDANGTVVGTYAGGTC